MSLLIVQLYSAHVPCLGDTAAGDGVRPCVDPRLQIDEVLVTMMRMIHSDDSMIVAARLVGRFVEPDAYLPLLLPAIAGALRAGLLYLPSRHPRAGAARCLLRFRRARTGARGFACVVPPPKHTHTHTHSLSQAPLVCACAFHSFVFCRGGDVDRGGGNGRGGTGQGLGCVCGHAAR
jgi:hypothetical protein